MSDATTETETNLITVTIDGKEIKTTPNRTIIEVADEHGITIPRFCYHKKLSVAANCRMCLVDVEGARRPAAACATPIMPDMVVRTNSPLAIDYQKSVMEFLLINHPLDCPICDQGGECELQDMAMGYGKDVSKYTEGKRAIPDKDFGPLIETDLTRCIHCTRCVRFTKEIAGKQELGMMHRGEHAEITTFLETNVESELSGNVIDLCPVGALTAKPSRYQARPWEMIQRASVAPHDCLGSNIYYHVRRGEVIRAVPKENEAINEVWLSDRDRYSYEGLQSETRVSSPMIKRQGEWEKVTWSQAIDFVVEQTNRIKDQYGPEQIGGLASSNSTLEELYLMQKVLRGLGTRNLDHRLWQQDFSQQHGAAHAPKIPGNVADLATHSCVLVVGSDVRREQPMTHHHLRMGALKGNEILTINPSEYEWRFPVTAQDIRAIDDLPRALAEVVKALLDQGKSLPSDAPAQLYTELTPSAQAKAIAASLTAHDAPVILKGQIALSHPQAGLIHSLIRVISEMTRAQVGELTPGANSAGAWLAGMLPHRQAAGESQEQVGLNSAEMLSVNKGLRAYFLLNTEPEFDSVFGLQAEKVLAAAECVVALTPFAGEGLLNYADVILPIAAHTETSGTYINAAGQWQSFVGCAQAKAEAKPAWKVWRVLANFFELPGFDYLSSQDVYNEISTHCERLKEYTVSYDYPDLILAHQATLKRLPYVPLYAADGLVRRSTALQLTHEAQQKHIGISLKTARSLEVQDGDQVTVRQGEAALTWPVKIDVGLADANVALPLAISETAGFTHAFGELTLTKVGATA